MRPPLNRPSLFAVSRAVGRVLGKNAMRHPGCREWEFVRARWLAFHVARSYGYSLPRIARYYDFDHSTVLHGCRRMKECLECGEHVEELARVMALLEPVKVAA